MTDVSRQTLQNLIEFIYTGEVNVNQHEFERFMSTAKALEIKGLADYKHPQLFEKPASAPTTSGTQFQSSHTLRTQWLADEVKYSNSISSSFQYPANDFQPQTDSECDGATALDAHDANFDRFDSLGDQEFDDQSLCNDNDQNKAGGSLPKTCSLKMKRAKLNHGELIRIALILI